MFDAEDTLAGCLAVVKSVVRPDAESRACGTCGVGLLLATDVADYLVGKGMPFRRAHEVVGALVRKLIAEEREFGSLSVADWRSASELFEPDVLNRVTPEASVRARQTPQSTAPSAVSAAMADVDRWLTTALLPLENQLC